MPASTLIHTLYATNSPNTNVSYSENSNNIFLLQSIELLVILYSINQLVNLQLWNSNFYPISIFGTND